MQDINIQLPPTADDKTSIDVKLFVRALIELNIARKNILMYPQGHARIQVSVDSAFGYLNRCLNNCGEIRLGFAKDAVWVGGQALEPDNAVLKELTLTMKEQEIAAVRFQAGISHHELIDFLHRLAGMAVGSVSLGSDAGDAPVDPCLDLGHIAIEWIDYRRFGHTEEEEIHRKAPDDSSDPTESIWHRYIQLLTAEADATGCCSTSLRYSPQLTPSALAGLFNQRAGVDEKAQRSFEYVIHEHLRNVQTRSRPSLRRTGFQDKFNQFLEKLNAPLRKQFLSITYDQCAAHQDPDAVENFIDTFPMGLLMEMLSQANHEGKEIPPTLLNFVSKLSNSRLDFAGACQAETPGNLVNDLMSLDQLRAGAMIFQKEHPERYLPADYGAVLKGMANTNFAGALADNPEFDLEPHLSGLEESSLTERIATVLIAFLERSEYAEAYREYADALMGQIDDLLQTSRHGLVLEIHKLFNSHARGHPSDSIRAAAGDALERFKDTRLVGKIVSFFENTFDLKNPGAIDLLVSLGPNVIPHFFSLAVESKSDRLIQLVKGLLKEYPERFADELTGRMEKSSAREAAEILDFVDRLGDRQTVFRLRPYLKDQRLAIRNQVLQLLLKHQDPYAISFISELLDSGDTQCVCTGIDLARRYEVTGMAPKLRRMVKRHFLFFRSHYLINERLFLALKKMGYPESTGELRPLLRKKYSVYPEQLSRMKAALFQWIGG